MTRSTLAALLLVGALAAPGLAAQAPTAPLQAREHTVVEGNTLWNLAARFYGDPLAWTVIYEANRDRLAAPDVLEPGMTLVIPDRDMAGRSPAPVRTDEDAGQVVPAGIGAIRISGEGETQRREVTSDARPGYTDPRPRTAFYEQPTLAAQAPGTVSSRPLRAIPAEIARGAPFMIPRGDDAGRVGALHPLAGAALPGQLRYSARVYDRMVLEPVEGRAAPPVGARLQAYRVIRDVEGLGRVAQVTGVVRIEELVEGGAIVEVLEQYGRMEDGDLVRLLPADPPSAPAETRAVQDARTFTVLAVEEEQPIQGPGDWVFVDVRDAGGLQPGDELVVRPDPSLAPRARLQVVAMTGGIASVRIVHLRDVSVAPGVTLRLDRRLR